jgi:hypothetical protein
LGFTQAPGGRAAPKLERVEFPAGWAAPMLPRPIARARLRCRQAGGCVLSSAQLLLEGPPIPEGLTPGIALTP